MNTICQEEAIAIKRCRSGQADAFEPIVTKYMKQAYSIALGLVGNREDALDLSQEAFFRAYSNIHQLNPKKRFFPWFYQILRNICFSHLRKRIRRHNNCPQTNSENIALPAPPDSFDPEAIAERNELKDSVWKAIAQLDEKYREVIILRHFQNFSYEKIAQTLFCSKGTVMSRLYYARKKLKEVLDDQKGGRQNDL